MSTSELDVAREVLAKYYQATEPFDGVHTVTFQPLANKSSQDRVVTQQWEIAGQELRESWEMPPNAENLHLVRDHEIRETE